MITGPHQKFCEGIVAGLSRSAAYAAAYPTAKRASTRSHGSKLFRKPHIQAEIAVLRKKADEIAGSAVLTNVEIRAFLARIVRAKSGSPDEDTDLGKPVTRDGTDAGIRTRDKLHAVKLAGSFAPPPPPAESNTLLAEITELIRRIRTGDYAYAQPPVIQADAANAEQTPTTPTNEPAPKSSKPRPISAFTDFIRRLRKANNDTRQAQAIQAPEPSPKPAVETEPQQPQQPQQPAPAPPQPPANEDRMWTPKIPVRKRLTRYYGDVGVHGGM